MMDPTSCDQLDGCRGADAPADLRDDGDSNQSSGDDDDSGDGVYGGLVRALLRGKAAAADSVPRTVVQQIPGGGAAMPPAPSTVLSTLTTPSALAPTVPPTGMPSIPAGGARIATPQIARVADQLDSVVSAVEEIQNVQKARIMHETRVQRWYQQLRTVIPSFLRGAIMGTLLFTTYEEVQEKIADTVGEAVPASTVGYVCAGGIAGAVHGSAQTAVDISLRRAQGLATTTPMRLLVNSTRLETIQYACTFGTFEISKRTLLHLTNASPDSFTGVGSVATAGAGAGAVNAIVEGMLTSRRFLPFPLIVRQMPTSALAFVAFEYAKDVVDSFDNEEAAVY
eukprot:m.106818 g.106818  ORF g.106818 m.106818 type:complete len:339 (+) comp16915_c0_seq8:345-1361(+)